MLMQSLIADKLSAKQMSHSRGCMKKTIVYFVMSMAFSASVNAQSAQIEFAASQKEKCSFGGQSQMNRCMAAEYKKTNAEMSDQYSKLIATLQNPQGVKNSQRAWVKYRDAECSNEVMQLDKNSSLYSYAISACLIEFTQQRAQLLEWHSAQDCNGCAPRKN